MGELLFVPTGRVGPADFMRGVLVLIVIALIIDLLPAFEPTLGLLGFTKIFLVWCWVALWIKRYHDSGQSGWMSLVPIFTYVVIGWVVSIVLAMFLFSSSGLMDALGGGENAGDADEAFDSLLNAGTSATFYIVSALATAAISYGIAFGFNKMIHSEPAPNRFGPPSSDALAATFD